MIDSFTGQYRFLSNFHPCTVTLDGIEYPSTEHAYQAAKTEYPALRVPFESGTAAAVKKLGRRLKIRPDWEEVKLSVMENLLRQKFAPGSELLERLAQTQGQKLCEGNYWHDNFWGSCTCQKNDVCRRGGSNHLGKLLMKIRDGRA